MQQPKQNFILSPCGTSLLTHRASEEERQLINKFSNAKSKEDTASNAEKLQQILERQRQKLSIADPNHVWRLSAELNAIVKLYGGNLYNGARDYHVLLCTDTWLGEQAAEAVGEWMRGKGLNNVEVKRQTDLQTADVTCFQVALAEIVQWCEETLPVWQQSGYHIIFNLTGGFKSVQGFLQTLAMFYADESVYIFESADLLRIPRIPIQINAEEILEKFVKEFRRMANKLLVPEFDVSAIPQTMLMIFDGQATLSPWGEIVWQRSWKSLYERKLHPSPSDLIVYGESFSKSVAGLPGSRIKEVNQKIDDLAKFLEEGKHLKSLDLKPLKGNPKPGSTHEIDAWSDQDAKRIFGHYDEQKRFVLDCLDKALH